MISYDGQNYVVVGSDMQTDDGNDERQQTDMATVIRRDGTYMSKLTIRSAAESDAGLYVCSTTNHAGYTYRQAYLTVRTGETHTCTDLACSTLHSRAAEVESWVV